MTREAYFDMCEMLGSTAVEEEIPVEYEDLILEVQEAVQIYNNLQDSWDYMGGNYIGKNLVGFKDILNIFEVPIEDHKAIYSLIMRIDNIRAKIISEKKPKT